MDANTTIIIALVTLVLAIFGASRLNQRQTEKFLEQLEKRFDARFDTLLNEFRSEIKLLDQRLESIEARLARVGCQLEFIFKPVLPK